MVGNPHRAQISQFELFELILSLKLYKQSLSSSSRQQDLSQQCPPPPLRFTPQCFCLGQGPRLPSDGPRPFVAGTILFGIVWCGRPTGVRPASLPAERLAEYGWKPHRGFVGSQKHITGLSLLVYARKAEGYGFIEFEISNSTTSTVFRQPLICCILVSVGADAREAVVVKGCGSPKWESSRKWTKGPEWLRGRHSWCSVHTYAPLSFHSDT